METKLLILVFVFDAILIASAVILIIYILYNRRKRRPKGLRGETLDTIVKSLTPSELFDLGWFFNNAVKAAQVHHGIPEREFARCLTMYTGNDKIDKILTHVSRKIKLGEKSPIVFAKTELYNMLNESIS